MELTLTRPPDSAQVAVACEGAPSHTFDLTRLIPARGVTGRPPQPLEDPIKYGEAVYAALFPSASPARRTLEAQPERILLVLEDVELHTIPWEYARGPRGFVVLDFHFARGLPPGQRIAAPTLMGGLHVVAVPSNPLEQDIPPLNIDGEWERLKEIIGAIPAALSLERARPPTLEKLRDLLAGQTNRVAHFMGHGGEHDGQAVLLFEKENGAVDFVTAQEFVRRVRKTVFLVTLNACVSATPGPTEFSNLAAALAAQGVPYALGMRFSIVDDDARAFSRRLYGELARGSSVEEAVMQARQTLEKNERAWAVGVPVLYTSLSAPAPGFARAEGAPRIEEHQLPPELMELSALPRAMGAFQGRVAELKAIGGQLTGDKRPRLLTLHGGGGQGKTALAREAAERFAHAWPGGVWAISLENLPDQATFLARLAEFLGLPVEPEPRKLEALVLARLHARRTLLVLDNAETLVEAVRAGDEAARAARELADFAREHMPPTATLLVTSRVHLDWPGEAALELGGLNPADGAELFKQSAPRRAEAIDQELAEELSRAVSGHPLSLRLLGGAFNETTEPLAEFVKQAEERLLKAEDIYKSEDHRHRTLYASLETSARYLPDELRQLLSGLWIFHAPFLPDIAVAIFDPTKYPEGQRSPVYDQLHALWGRGLLTVDLRRLRDGDVLLYHLLPTVRPFAERYLPQAHDREELPARFGAAYSRLAVLIYDNRDKSATLVYVAQQARADLERGYDYTADEAQAYYGLHWGYILHRLGEAARARQLTERTLEWAQGTRQRLQLEAMNNLVLVYQAIGQPQRALALYEQALPMTREVGDRAGEAATLNNLALVYQAIGQPQRALELFEQALPIRREVGDRAGEAATLNNLALVYQAIGQPQRALELCEQALPIRREVGDRAGEATTLNNLALVYQAIGQPQRALELYEQALPIMREVGDRAGEAATLNNLGEVYRATGQPQRALELYEQALPIRREVGARAGEATTLNNLGEVYRAIGQPRRALELYEQALPIAREVSDRAGEATTLNNLALVYRAIGQPQRALALYEQALPIALEVGDRAGEATTLNNLAAVYDSIGQPQRALELYEQALPIAREVGDRAGEAAILNGLAYLLMSMERYQEALTAFQQSITLKQQVQHYAGESAGLVGMARLLYQHLHRLQEAIVYLEQAIAVLQEMDLPQNAAGDTPQDLRQLLAIMRKDAPLGTSADTEIQAGIKHGGPQELSVPQDVAQAVQAFLNAEDWTATRQVVEAQQAMLFRPEAAELLQALAAQAQSEGNQRAAEMFQLHLAILRECQANGVGPTFEKLAQAQRAQQASAEPAAGLPPDFVEKCATALAGPPPLRATTFDELRALAAALPVWGPLIHAVQNALFGTSLNELGGDLTGEQAAIWKQIVEKVLQ